MATSVFGRCVQRPSLLLACAVWLVGLPAQAQIEERSTPTAAYFTGVALYNEGDYKDALDIFLSEGRGAIKTAQSRWIDSICYHTMCGECFYQMGDPGKAVEHYTSALELFTAFSDWLVRVQFPPAIRPASPGAVKAVPWGFSSRRARPGHFPSSMLMSQGQIDNNAPFRQGGIVQQAVLFPVHVQEIVRCTTLAIRRRGELLGPIATVDPLTNSVLNALNRRPGPPNHWSEAWIDVQLGMAFAAAGKDAQAVPLLQRGSVAAGEFDHPMTCSALLELGILALRQGNLTAGSKFLEEATYAAVNFGEPMVLEEALRYGMISHLIANRPGIYPPLATGVAWAKVKGTRRLHAALALLAAENFAVRGQTADAQRLLEEARFAMGRRTMAGGNIGARLSFIAAMVAYQQRRIADGDAAVATAMNYMRGGSTWLFQIALADNLYVSGARYVTSRTAIELYRTLLRDPLAADWASDPMESLAVLVTPHPGPMERWFEVAMSRKEFEAALEIGDRLRRHRFFSSLMLGGRLQSLRWVLGAAPDALDRPSQLVRGDLLVRYAAYEQLEQAAKKLREQLAAQPLVAENSEQLRQQSQALSQWGTICVRQEAMLREIAVRREPAGLAFPPLCATVDVQKSLPNKHAVLAFLVTSRHIYAFLLNNQRYSYWEVGSPAAVYRRTVDFLRQMGHFEQNRELSLKELAGEQWKQAGELLLESLLKGSQADLTQPLDELVIVPDGFLWYLPFEALQVKIDRKWVPLLSRFRIRYAPTLSLVLPDGRGRKPTARTAVVVGNLFGRDTEPMARETAEKLAKVLPGTAMLKAPLPAPSAIYAGLFDRLVVLDEIPSTDSPYGWSPVTLDRGKAGSTLNDWLALPWQGPAEIVLPGFHTAAESALKRANASGAGGEVFLSVCGMMASGARTILLSRWRTGGQSSCDLVREFTQELPHSQPAEAWQRAVMLANNTPLNLEAEPRVKVNAGEEVPNATHPFFWAGYMLVDTGAEAHRPDAQAEAPAAKPGEQGAPPGPEAKPAAKPDLAPAPPDAPPGKGAAKGRNSKPAESRKRKF
jgi:CHAT domain-containing protein